MAKRSDEITGRGERRPEDIRGDIEKTRRRMSRTVEEIQERFSPEHLRGVAGETFREQKEKFTRKARSTVAGARSGMSDMISENPFAAVAAGLGLGWIITGGLFGGGRGRMEGQEYGEEYSEGAGGRAGRLSGQARQYGARAGRKALQGYRMVSGRFGSMMERDPLVLAAITLAAGAVLGLSMPASEKEREYIGKASEKLKETVQKESKRPM